MIDYFSKNLNDTLKIKEMLENLLIQAKGMEILRAGLKHKV
jgi:hypothetical protein